MLCEQKHWRHGTRPGRSSQECSTARDKLSGRCVPHWGQILCDNRTRSICAASTAHRTHWPAHTHTRSNNKQPAACKSSRSFTATTPKLSCMHLYHLPVDSPPSTFYRIQTNKHESGMHCRLRPRQDKDCTRSISNQPSNMHDNAQQNTMNLPQGSLPTCATAPQISNAPQPPKSEHSFKQAFNRHAKTA